jgi:hypothetical protein
MTPTEIVSWSFSGGLGTLSRSSGHRHHPGSVVLPRGGEREVEKNSQIALDSVVWYGP